MQIKGKSNFNKYNTFVIIRMLTKVDANIY